MKTKTKLHNNGIMFICSLAMLIPLRLYSQTSGNNFFKQEFDLAGERSQQTQFYAMQNEVITHALDGKRTGMDLYKLYLKWIPAKLAGKAEDEFTCVKFIVQLGDELEATIPVLKNWSYSFKDGIDENNQVFGIDHSKFEDLKDSNGRLIPTEKAYHVYNAFIDFHGCCNVFAERTAEGNGIQELKVISQKIVHAAAFTEPPTHLGKNIAEGSFFKNGEIILEFKGLTLTNDKVCALIGFDSGESSFKMIVRPAANFEVVAVGSSHYKGDIYKDIESNWVQKVMLDEVVIAEATLPLPPNKVNSVVERSLVIRNVSEADLFKF